MCKRKKNELTILLNVDRVTRIALELKRVDLVEIEGIKPTLQNGLNYNHYKDHGRIWLRDSWLKSVCVDEFIKVAACGSGG